MARYDTEEIAGLVQDGRVHRAVYTDPDLFELEMERVFGRAWLCIGHDSQIPRPGDFVTTRMGRQPVIMVRQRDGSVRVLYNRCTHRGATVCSLARGNAKSFTCPYHGWTYGVDGTLQGVPVPEGYDAGFKDRMKSELGLTEVARVSNYRGFVFASLAHDGPPLQEFLGHMATSIDDLVDRAPDGDAEIAGGVAKHVYEGNWKFVIENHNDTIHPRFVHASSVAAAADQPDGAPTDGSGEIALRQMRQNGAPPDVWERLGLWTSDYGHSYMGDYHDDEKLLARSEDPVHRAYRERLEARHGPERTRQILGVSRFNSIIYPNLSFMSQFGQLRIVHPIAVDRTAVYTYVFRLKGAPEEMFETAVAFANVVNGIGSCVLTDDLETYERLQVGLASQGTDWVDVSRGAGRDEPDEHGLERGATGTSEIHIRNQFRAWRHYMTAEA